MKCEEKETLNKKLSLLIKNKNSQQRPQVQQIPDYIENLSTFNFTEKEIALLNNGLNFVPTPKNINIDNTITDIETSFKYLTDTTINLIRKEAEPIIKEIEKTSKNKKY